MTQLTAIRDMDAVLHEAFAGAGIAFTGGTYTPAGALEPSATQVRGYVNLGVQVLGDFQQVVDRRDEIELLRADVPDPRKGATVVAEGRRYQLDAKVFDDEGRSVWVVLDKGAA